MIYDWLKPPGYGDFNLPLSINTDQLIETENSKESQNIENHKSIIVKAFSSKSNDTLNKVCLEIANNLKKFVYQKEKPNRMFICALITKTAYIFDKRGRELHGDYFEYELLEDYFFVVKCAYLDNDARIEESRFISHRIHAQSFAFAESTAT